VALRCPRQHVERADRNRRTLTSMRCRTLGKANQALRRHHAGAQSPSSTIGESQTIDQHHRRNQWTSPDVDIKAHAYEGLLERPPAKAEGRGAIPHRACFNREIDGARAEADPRAHVTSLRFMTGVRIGRLLVAAYEWLMNETGALRTRCCEAGALCHCAGTRRTSAPTRWIWLLHGLEPGDHVDTIYETPTARRALMLCWRIRRWHEGARTSAGPRRFFTVETSDKAVELPPAHLDGNETRRARRRQCLPDNCLLEGSRQCSRY